MPDPAQQAMQTPDPSGPTRHPNHWSVEAREDMFGRREAGEGWETICKVRHVKLLRAYGEWQ